MEFLSFSLVNIDNCTPFLIHSGIYTCCCISPFFLNHAHPRVITYRFQGWYKFSLDHLNRSLSSTYPLIHSLCCTSLAYILRVMCFWENTKAHELWVISVLKFYSFLSTVLKFSFGELGKVVALRFPFFLCKQSGINIPRCMQNLGKYVKWSFFQR